MSTSEFDELLRRKMDEDDFDFAPASWTQMAQDLDKSEDRKVPPPTRRRYWLAIIGTIASTAAVWASVSLFLRSTPARQETYVAQSTHVAMNNAHTPATTSIQQTLPQPESVAQATSPVSGMAIASGIKPTTAARHIAAKISGTDNIAARHATPAITTAETNSTAAVTGNTTELQPGHPDPLKGPGMRDQPAKEQGWSNQDFVYNHRNNNTPARTSLGIAGGLNYGTSRPGYTVGVNARRSLGSKFFVEGDVALVSNATQNASTVATTEYNTITDGSNIGTGTGQPPVNAATAMKNASSKQSLNNLYYLQVAPSLGYRVYKQLSVSAGADVQRMLQHNNNETAMTVTDEVKLIPETDIGLTGKIEYGITPKLVTGVSYREGLNAMMDSKYMNRSYLQVQVKFLFFNK
jgi:hypothetical protein